MGLKLQRNYINFFIVLISLLVSKSLYYETFGQNILLLFLFLSLIILLYTRAKKKISTKKILFLILVFFWIFLNPGTKFTTASVFLLSLINATLITELIDFKYFSLTFFRIIKFLILFSFLRYLILFFSIESPFLDFVSILGDKYSNFLVFGIPETSASISLTFFQTLRNNGLWYEPGAFQIFINLGFLFGIINNKITFKVYIVFLIGILSTVSTAGIIIFIILTYYYIDFSLMKIVFSFIFLLLVSYFFSFNYF